MDWSNKKVLVTGSQGFIGSYLIEKLQALKANIFTFTHKDGNIITAELDYKVDIIFHLAAKTNKIDSTELTETNIKGTENILKLARKCRAKIIFPSTYVYGDPKYLPIDEKHPVTATTPYHESKIKAEELIQEHCKATGLSASILRIFNVYGKGMNQNYFIPIQIKEMQKQTVEVWQPKPKRDYVYVTDVVDAMIKAAEINGFEIFNIAFGKSYSFLEVVQTIMKVLGVQKPIEVLNKELKHDIMDTKADISKARKVLKWQPQIDLEEGLRLMLNK